jgi:hypothetical protein
MLALAPCHAVDGAAIFDTSYIGKGEKIFTVKLSSWGRFCISAESQEGTAIGLIDEKSGPVADDGVAGQKNGRIDLYLEKGEYRIVTRSDVMSQRMTKMECSG